VKSQHENAAARMVAGRGKYEHMTAMLRDVLHWLPVPQRIQFKIAFLTFSCVRGGASPRFQHVCIATANLSGRAGLRSAGRRDLVVLTTATELSKRSFHVAAPVIWNSLPEHLRSLSASKGQCQCGLKTHLFSRPIASENPVFKE